MTIQFRVRDYQEMLCADISRDEPSEQQLVAAHPHRRLSAFEDTTDHL
jgi:hypothetical protein